MIMEQAHENKMTRDETLKVALMVGKILLKSGAETYRVEDTINRFCIANGYEVDIFVTPTVIILGNEQVDSFNCVSRIRYRTTNLGMISEMNDMSYKFERWPMSYRGTMAWLEEKLKAQVPYGKWKVCLASAIASASFSAMLGGNSHDFIAAFITGGIAMLVLKQIAGYRPSAFWENALAGVAIGVVALICCAVSVQCTMEKIIVGALMPFVPGVAFTNGLRDYMAGDLLSGNARIAEALLFAASIAIGIAFALRAWVLWGWDYGNITSFIFAFIATMAFAVLFQSPKKILLTDGLIGAVGWVVFISLRDQMGYSSFYANFFGTLALALLSELSARIFKQPATVFVIPGIIPLVPGLGIYKGMFAVINNDYNGGMSILLTAITDSCAIAVGVMLVSSLFRVLKIRKDRRFLIKYHGKDVC